MPFSRNEETCQFHVYFLLKQWKALQLLIHSALAQLAPLGTPPREARASFTPTVSSYQYVTDVR